MNKLDWWHCSRIGYVHYCLVQVIKVVANDGIFLAFCVSAFSIVQLLVYCVATPPTGSSYLR